MFIHTQTYSGRKSVDCDVIAINVSIILVGVVSVNRSKYDFGSLHTAHTSFTYLEDCENYGGCVLYMNACLLVLQFFSKHIFLQQNICRTARSLHVKWANKLPDLYRNRNFAINLSKTIQCKIKKKIPSAVLEQFYAYRRMDGCISGVPRALKMPEFWYCHVLL